MTPEAERRRVCMCVFKNNRIVVEHVCPKKNVKKQMTKKLFSTLKTKKTSEFLRHDSCFYLDEYFIAVPLHRIKAENSLNSLIVTSCRGLPSESREFKR